MEIQVIDDLLPQSYADSIESAVLGKNMVWSYMPTTSNLNLYADKGATESPQFVHMVQDVGGGGSDYQPLFFPILWFLEQRTGQKSNTISRIKLNLLLKNLSYPEDGRHTAHVDTATPHIAALYYPIDSDGDTFFFNECYNQTMGVGIPSTLTVRQRVAPKKNRLVVFDGRIFHASSAPREHLHRFCLNINFV